MDETINFETKIKEEYQELWSDPKSIHRDDDKLFLGWHFGYYEKGHRTYKKAIINMNNYVGRLLDIKDNNYRILDAGCGVGATLLHLAKNYPNSNFFGVTLSSNEINLAENLKRKNNMKNVNFYQQSYNNTDFTDEYFDCVYALESTWYAKDKSVFFREMNRILKKNGKFIIIDMHRQNDLTNPFFINFRAKLIKEKNFKDARITIEKIKELLTKEGFKIIQIFDLIKQRNVKFYQIYFFMFYCLFKKFHHDVLKEIRQESYRPLFFRCKFFCHFMFIYSMVIFSRFSYFSIIAVKK